MHKNIEKQLTHVNVNDFIKITNGKCIIRFWAPWCTPCRINSNVIAKSLQQTNLKYKTFSINVDREPALAQSMGVKYIPETIVFDRKKIKHYVTGELTVESLIKLIG